MTESTARKNSLPVGCWIAGRTLCLAALIGISAENAMLFAQNTEIPNTEIPNADVPNTGAPVPATPIDPLTTEQQQVALRFKKLEELLLRSAELESAENPARSALLQQAAQLGKQSQLADLLARAATRLDKKQYSQALEDQKTSRENLKRLLELLQSENRGERVREQRDQVRRWIEETDRLLRLQKSLSGRTEGGQEMNQAAGDQNKLSEKAQEIARELGADKQNKVSQAAESADSKEKTDKDGRPADGQPNDDKSSDAEKSAQKAKDEKATPKADGQSDESSTDGKESTSGEDGQPASDSKADQNPKASEPQPAEDDQPQTDQSKPSEAEPQTGQAEGKPKDKPKDKTEGKPQDTDSPNKDADAKASEESSESEPGQTQRGEQKPSQSGQPQQGQSQPGESGESEPQQPEPESKDPTQRARKRIEQAQQKMEEAKRALDNAERKGAVEKQREAEAELRSAIEALEEILRQLREEEIERSLASLETRLRRMLEMQNKVFEETQRLQEITGEQATRQIEIRASNLSLEERKILTEGERAFLLLRDEGSSAAFPEAMEQVNTDIGNVAERLGKADIGKLTTTIQQEIISSLEEMVAALVQVQKEKKEQKQKQQQGQQQQQGEPGEQPLVDKLAELRLIRTLQVRINNRTTALSEMLADPADAIGQATEADILGEVKGLANRQSSIQKVTREIVVGADE